MRRIKQSSKKTRLCICIHTQSSKCAEHVKQPERENTTVSKSQNVKDRSRANKYLGKIKVNLRTKVGICISTYSNADVVCYSTAPPGEWR